MLLMPSHDPQPPDARERWKPDAHEQYFVVLGDGSIKIFHIPSDLVVDQWASDGENSSHCDFLFRHDVWTMFVARSVRKQPQLYQWLGTLPLNPVESGFFRSLHNCREIPTGFARLSQMTMGY